MRARHLQSSFIIMVAQAFLMLFVGRGDLFLHAIFRVRPAAFQKEHSKIIDR
jgi:hypothetical protein